MTTEKKSALAYAVLILFVIVLRVALTLFPVDHPQARQALIQWKEIFLLAAMGFALVRLAPRAGFPDLWNDQVSQTSRFLVPAGLAILFAGLTMAESLLYQWPNFHVPFPQSVFVYGSASVLYELKYHLMPMVLIVWAGYDLGLGDTGGRRLFWIVAILVSVYEPLNQLPGMVKMGMVSGTFSIAASGTKIFLGNLVPLYLFRRSGLLAMIVFRFVTYMLWHVAWPVLYFGGS